MRQAGKSERLMRVRMDLQDVRTASDPESREADHSKPVITWSGCGKCCALFANLRVTGQGRLLCRPAGEYQAESMEPVTNPRKGRHAIGAEAVRQRSPPGFMKN